METSETEGVNGHSKEFGKTLDEEGVRTEKLLQLKNTRAGFKAFLTKKRNELLHLLETEEDIQEIQLKMAELNQAFENFKGAHDVYTRSLQDDKSIKESREYFNVECSAVKELEERVTDWISKLESSLSPHADGDVLPKDSVSQLGSKARSSVSSKRSKSSSGSAASSTRRKYVKEAAKRKALEAKSKVFQEQQALVQKRFQLHQQEKMLKIKSDLAQTFAREQVYAEEDALECGSDLEEKPVMPINSPKLAAEEPSQEPSDKSAEKMGTLNPLAVEWHPESSSILAEQKYQPQEQKYQPRVVDAVNPIFEASQTIQKMIDVQERQAKCMEGLAIQQHQSALTLTLPNKKYPSFLVTQLDIATL